MRKIFAIGETVYDIIFKDGRIQAGKAGGSMLNTSVSLGRTKQSVHFISEVGNDYPGNLILIFLRDNSVFTEYISRFDEGQTPIAIAFLDSDQNAKYSFYKNYPERRLQQTFPAVTKDDIVLFGSFFSISPEVRKQVVAFITDAQSKGAIVIYDPNIRKPHRKEIPTMIPMICENFAFADIIRASHEDFEAMFDINTPHEAFDLIGKHGNASLIYTRGDKSVSLRNKNHSLEFPVAKIEVVSTIGAGDNFNAGIITALIHHGLFRSDINMLSPETWRSIVSNGISFSQEVCKSYDNYISEAFAEKLL